MPWEVYTLADPETGAVRYVGQTTYGGGRIGTHIAEARSRAARRRPLTPKQAWLAGLLARGLEPVVAIVDTYAEKPDARTATAIERQWIEAHVEAGADLLNVQGHPVEYARSLARGWERRRSIRAARHTEAA
ncbi:MAG TPA: GIY-YIG nuclease family protein [Anaeromyxobacteraceae bacterium]|nr:GIY-YIG nuclease family protein [Anaeromyxobacteraceae bacterium]